MSGQITRALSVLAVVAGMVGLANYVGAIVIPALASVQESGTAGMVGVLAVMFILGGPVLLVSLFHLDESTLLQAIAGILFAVDFVLALILARLSDRSLKRWAVLSFFVPYLPPTILGIQVARQAQAARPASRASSRPAPARAASPASGPAARTASPAPAPNPAPAPPASLSGEEAASKGHRLRLFDLKAQLSGLTTQHPATGVNVGGGVSQAQEQVPIICQNIDDAIRALQTGLDRAGTPVNKSQIKDGLKRLVAETRKPAFVGLMTGALNSDGIALLEQHMGELERLAEDIGRPDWIATPEKQADQMSVILEWCQRNQAEVVNVNVVSFLGEPHESTMNTARGILRAVEEHPTKKGIYRLEFDSHLVNHPHDVLMLGFEVSGAEDQGSRLVIRKGNNQRIELEALGKAEVAAAPPEPQATSPDKPKTYTFWRGDAEVGRVELASGDVISSSGTEQAQVYPDGSGSKHLGSASRDGDIYRIHRDIYLKTVGRIDEHGEIRSLATDTVVGRVEPAPVPADAMSVVAGAALVFFVRDLPVPEKSS